MDDPAPGSLTQVLKNEGHDITVHSVTKLSGGASRHTYALDASDSEGPRPLIFQSDPAPEPRWPRGLADEAMVSALGRSAGMSVPHVLATNASPGADQVGANFQICEAIGGETIARRILRDSEYGDARERLAFDAGAELAKLHSASTGGLEFLTSLDQLTMYREVADELDVVSPAFELAFRWLELNRPEESRAVIVHGDFRLGNLIVSSDGIAAVIDWELAHIGDPHEDLAWLCVKAWRFGGSLPVAGVGSYDELVAGYESVSEWPVSRDDLRWWEVLGTLKWGVMCRNQYERYRTGVVRSVEMPAIGRRVAEQEFDLLTMLARPAKPDTDTAAVEENDSVGAEAPAGYRDPSASELIGAVREFLSGPVVEQTSGAVSFHARVAANALAIVERELAAGMRPASELAEALEVLDQSTEAAFATAIRSGTFDARIGEAASALLQSAATKVDITNPRWRT